MFQLNQLILILIAVFPISVSGYSQSKAGTYQTKDGKDCLLCPPGFHMNEPCVTSGEESSCEQCPIGHYITDYNNSSKCQACITCHVGQIEKEKCKPTKDTVCECPLGEWWKLLSGDQGKCAAHSLCKDGETVLNKGTPFADTVCQSTQKCPKGGGTTISFNAILLTTVIFYLYLCLA